LLIERLEGPRPEDPVLDQVLAQEIKRPLRELDRGPLAAVDGRVQELAGNDLISDLVAPDLVPVEDPIDRFRLRNREVPDLPIPGDQAAALGLLERRPRDPVLCRPPSRVVPIAALESYNRLDRQVEVRHQIPPVIFS